VKAVRSDGPTWAFRLLSKGNRVNLPEPGRGFVCGDATEPREAGGGPGKCSLFFLTASTKHATRVAPSPGRPRFDCPRIGLTGEGAGRLARAPHLLRRPVRLRRPLKTEASRVILPPGRGQRPSRKKDPPELSIVPRRGRL
jgi:hypothetical protein